MVIQGWCHNLGYSQSLLLQTYAHSSGGLIYAHSNWGLDFYDRFCDKNQENSHGQIREKQFYFVSIMHDFISILHAIWFREKLFGSVSLVKK